MKAQDNGERLSARAAAGGLITASAWHRKIAARASAWRSAAGGKPGGKICSVFIPKGGKSSRRIARRLSRRATKTSDWAWHETGRRREAAAWRNGGPVMKLAALASRGGWSGSMAGQLWQQLNMSQHQQRHLQRQYHGWWRHEKLASIRASGIKAAALRRIENAKNGAAGVERVARRYRR